MEYTLDELLLQESDLVFSHFDLDTAWRLGCQLRNRAGEEQSPVAIEVYAFGQVVFVSALSGSAPDNLDWIRRKRNSVLRFGHSSYYLGQSNKAKNRVFEEQHHIDSKEFAGHGGGFPIRLKNGGLIGAVTVSGLPQIEDHKLVTDILKQMVQQES